MFWNVVLGCALMFCIVGVIDSEETRRINKTRILSRRRRYVSFPDGSSFSCAGCMTVGAIGDIAPITDPGYFTFGLNWAIAYDLPNETSTLRGLRRLKGAAKPLAQRRNRRDLYQKLETIIDSMGYNGRDCVLKTLCETTQRIVPRGTNMIQEMFRTMFTLPLAKPLAWEPAEHAVYDSAHRLGLMMEDCDQLYSGCPLSLVDLAKGYYSTPATRLGAAQAAPWSLFSKSFG